MVRVVHEISGNVQVPAFDLDLDKLEINLRPDLPPELFEVKEVFTGTGFIISSDGFIITNSHVVSSTSVKYEAATISLTKSFYQQYLRMNDEKAASLYKRLQDLTEEEDTKINKALVDTVEAELNSKVTVLSPASKGGTMTELLEDGFEAQVVNVNNDYYFDQKDVALLKIEQKNLPAIDLGNSQNLASGKTMYVFGFPSSAQFSQGDLLEASFTKGVVSAIKNSIHNEFKVYQTDAKVSPGSSGGPFFGEDGKVVGILTFQTQASESGDPFAFAIPIELAKSMIEESGILASQGKYGRHLILGIGLMSQNHCQEANKEFQEASLVNLNFSTKEYIHPYIESCDEMISSGKSVDGFWDEIFQF